MSEDFGLKVSVEGKDVKTAEGLDVAFKNNLNLLKIAYSGNGTLPVGGSVTITHNLGYIPQFLVFLDSYNVYDNTTKRTVATGDYFTQSIAGSTSTELIIYGASGSNYTYYIFYETQNGVSQTIPVSSNNYGLKVTKTGKDTMSTNLDDQSLNSEKTCLKIAKTGIYETTSIDSNNHTVNIAHGLPYTPGFLCWFKIGDYDGGKYYFGTSAPGIYWTLVDGTNFQFTYDGINSGWSIKCCYILFVENA